MITEKDFNEKELFAISELYDQLVTRHQDCDGTGIVYTKDHHVADCTCEAVFKYCKELIFANIPKGYWGINVKDLEKYFNNESMESIMFESSAILAGLSGGGKTALLSLLGKLAVFKRKSVYYITSENLLKTIKSDEILIDRIHGADVILFDGLEKYVRSSWADGQIEYLLRSLKDNGKVLYIATSCDKDELEQAVGLGLSEFIESQIHNKFFIDVSKTRKDLRISDYFDKNFVKEATENFREILEAVEAI